jgi:putative PIN family toxin of toxin-antitoxin system
MRVLLDANIFISYLLSRKGSIHEVLRAAFDQRYTLILPQPLLDELVAAVSQKPRLSRRISTRQLQEFVEILVSIAESVGPLSQPIPPITRDPKDDYLIAYSVVEAVDYLVTGDQDLLVLEEIAGVSILSPTALFQLLAAGDAGA